MVDYVRVWGGMPSGVHVKLITHLINLTGADVHVSGTVFDALAKLKFPANSIPSHLVTALVVTHGSSEEEQRDGIARMITISEIKSLMNPKNLDTVLNANRVLARIVNEMKDETSNDKNALFVQLMKDVVLFVLARKSHADKTLEGIVTAFATSICGHTGATPADADESATAEGITYDGDGLAVGGGKMVVVGKGFFDGQIVARKPKKNETPSDATHTIVHIDDSGAVHLKDIGHEGEFIGEPFAVPLETFLEDYQKVKSALKFHKNYPVAEPKNMAHALQCMRIEAMGMLAMHEMITASLKPTVRIVVSPNKSVDAMASFHAHQMTLISATTSLIVETSPKKIQEHQAKEGTYNVGYSDKDVSVFIKCTDGPNWCAPFWHIPTSDDEAKCNMKLESRSFTVKAAVREGSKAHKPLYTFTFPVAVNTKELNKYDKLVLYKVANKKPPSTKVKVVNFSIGEPKAKHQKV